MRGQECVAAIGKAIIRLEPELFNVDKIIHRYIHSGGRKHQFQCIE